MIEVKNMQSQKGIALIDMAIAVIVTGLIISMAILGFSKVMQFSYEKRTLADIERVADAISIYAQKHMRVPCPADPANADIPPFGAERGSGSAGRNFGSCASAANAVGIIPFATLGLPRRYAQDRYGNYLTYRVSPVSADQPALAVGKPINQWCMTNPYWNNGSGDYVALEKAAFCCGTLEVGQTPATVEDVDIFGSRNVSILNRAVARSGGDPSEYKDSTQVPATLLELANDVPPMFPAYVIVSHGQNGLGAYSKDGGIRNLSGMNTTERRAERENADDDRIFYASDRNMSASVTTGINLSRRLIDDIVFWQTPGQVLNRVGGISCARP